MLREIQSVRQDRPRRRWFSDEEFDLVVWFSETNEVTGFELSYDKGTSSERAFTWLRDEGVSHERVDNGEARPGKYKMSPVLFPDGPVDAASLLRKFEAVGSAIEPDILTVVTKVIRCCDEANHRVQTDRAKPGR